MDPQQSQNLRLHWNKHGSHLTKFLAKLYNSDLFSDVTVHCEGHVIKAHQLVLSSCSPYFKHILVENTEPNPRIIICDIRYEDIKTLLKFMYYGEVNVSQTCVPDFFKTAEAFQVSGFNADNVFNDTVGCGISSTNNEVYSSPGGESESLFSYRKNPVTPRNPKGAGRKRKYNVSAFDDLGCPLVPEVQLHSSSKTDSVPLPSTSAANHNNHYNNATNHHGNTIATTSSNSESDPLAVDAEFWNYEMPPWPLPMLPDPLLGPPDININHLQSAQKHHRKHDHQPHPKDMNFLLPQQLEQMGLIMKPYKKKNSHNNHTPNMQNNLPFMDFNPAHNRTSSESNLPPIELRSYHTSTPRYEAITLKRDVCNEMTTSERVFFCKLCPKSFNFATSATRHYNKEHLKKYKCNKCLRCFSRKPYLQHHLEHRAINGTCMPYKERSSK